MIAKSIPSGKLAMEGCTGIPGFLTFGDQKEFPSIVIGQMFLRQHFQIYLDLRNSYDHHAIRFQKKHRKFPFHHPISIRYLTKVIG